MTEADKMRIERCREMTVHAHKERSTIRCDLQLWRGYARYWEVCARFESRPLVRAKMLKTAKTIRWILDTYQNQHVYSLGIWHLVMMLGDNDDLLGVLYTLPEGGAS